MQKRAVAWIAGFALVLTASGSDGGPAAAGPLASPGCQAGGEPATVTAVDPALLLHLSDGRIVRVAGIHVERPDDAPAAPSAEALSAWLAGISVRVAPVLGEPDRWGRTVALVFAPTRTDPAASISVGEALLDAGLASLQPDPGLDACWATYRQIEDAARSRGAGLWARTDAVLDPGDRPALLRNLGTWTIVEGRVGTVREGRSRTYVRFAGADTGFAVAIDHATLQRLGRTAGPVQQWGGRRLLARGLLDDRWGLQIDVGSPEQITVSPPDAGSAAFH